MIAALEIVAEEIAALHLEAGRKHIWQHGDAVRHALKVLVANMAERMPEGVRGFDEEEFRKLCGMTTPRRR